MTTRRTPSCSASDATRRMVRSISPILVAENPDLCLECHPAFEGQNKHPVRQEFFDVHAKKGLTCSSSCHNPHGTDYEFMIRNFNSPQDGQCLQCHKFVGIYF